MLIIYRSLPVAIAVGENRVDRFPDGRIFFVQFFNTLKYRIRRRLLPPSSVAAKTRLDHSNTGAKLD
ncbi:MAG: hypothetical protein DME20_03270 [Verrucomicrobia bacterium]|nr:MAG: hypothetical protein DME20_03270 [Verrucomicrobiota bacterium]